MSYTQPPPLTDEETDSLLREAKIARFCTFNKDGTIHAAPVWYVYQDGRIIVCTPEASRKARNIRRNKKVTILLDTSEGEAPPRCAIVYGEAELQDYTSDMIPELASFSEKYMPKEKAEAYAKGVFKLTKWVKITVKPIRKASFDYGKDQTYQSIFPE